MFFLLSNVFERQSFITSVESSGSFRFLTFVIGKKT